MDHEHPYGLTREGGKHDVGKLTHRIEGKHSAMSHMGYWAQQYAPPETANPKHTDHHDHGGDHPLKSESPHKPGDFT